MKKPSIFFPLLIIILSINLLQAQSKLSATAPAGDMNKIMGNWAQKSSNTWQFGFFENFANNSPEDSWKNVNMKAPRPEQKDQLVKEITKLLN